MVETLLDFRRMESGVRTFQMEETNLVELAKQVVDEFRHDDPRSSHTIEVDVEAKEGAKWMVHANRESLSLAFRNILENAIKYSPEHSKVRVALVCRDKFIGICVEDQGLGISKDEQRSIFQKFVRGSAARTLIVKGTGIGLTMANQIVRSHGGRVELVSEIGQGTRFTILLPLLNSQS